MQHNTKSETLQPFKKVYKLNDLIDIKDDVFRGNKVWNDYNDVFNWQHPRGHYYMASVIAREYIKQVLIEIIQAGYVWYYASVSLRVIAKETGSYNPRTRGLRHFVGISVNKGVRAYKRIAGRIYRIQLSKRFHFMLNKAVYNFKTYDTVQIKSKVHHIQGHLSEVTEPDQGEAVQ